MKHGVYFVALLGVVLKLHRTDESFSTHFLPNIFNRLYILGLSPCKIMPLARSTWPLVRG